MSNAGERAAAAAHAFRLEVAGTTCDEQRLVSLLGTEMLKKLKANRHKFERGNWLTLSREKLLALLEDECDELHTAAHPWDSSASAEEIAAECGDVANFVAMILDHVLQEEE